MTKREKYILMGNGFNLCLDNHISWDNLLIDIAAEYGIDHNDKLGFDSYQPYERIYLSYSLWK